MRPDLLRRVSLTLLACSSCGGVGAPEAAGTTGIAVPEETGSTLGPSSDNATTDGSDPVKWDFGGSGGCGSPWQGRLDLLVVVENTSEMAAVQSRFAQTVISLVRSLENATDVWGGPAELDVQLMVTTTERGNPACDVADGERPADGAPLVEGCNARLAQFGDTPETCTARCPVDVVPSEPFIAFRDEATSNVVGGRPVDLDGDGLAESLAAQAAACLAPVGLTGCAYPSALGAMRHALDPEAAWNQGDRPFVRPGSAIGIVVVQASPDCDVADPSVMDDSRFMAINPQTGEPETSQATCWNAGVSCQQPDEEGTYASCLPAGDAMVPTSTYSEFLVSQVGTPGCTPMFMVALSGVPGVTAHDRSAPFFPEEGGLDALLYRDVVDAPFPDGDLLPEDADEDVTAADKQFMWGIGPGCSSLDASGDRIAQPRPDPRTFEVCRGLDRPDDPRGQRCCIESACDDNHDGVVACMTGVVQLSMPLTGPPW